jgi:hypothetical protein
VRVPLSDGPLDGMIHNDSSFCENCNENGNDITGHNEEDINVNSDNDNRHSYEAVALDCSFAKKNKNRENNNNISDDNKTKIKNNLMSKLSSETKEKESIEKNSDITETKMDYVLLILAGLSGGSSEGYVLDLVRTANEKGEKKTQLYE